MPEAIQLTKQDKLIFEKMIPFFILKKMRVIQNAAGH